MLLSAGVITIASAAAITITLTREDKQENNFVDLNELPNTADGDTPDGVDYGDSGDITGNQEFAVNETPTPATDPPADDTNEEAEGSPDTGNEDTVIDSGQSTETDPSQSQDEQEQENHSGSTESGAVPDSDSSLDGELSAEVSGSLDTPVFGTDSSSLHYQESDGLLWPVQGNIILNYSMDHVIYHPTLNSYRTNPAILIGAEAGTLVTAAARGIVLEIRDDPMTGITVTTEIGDGYTLVYGQLTDVTVTEGQLVEAGTSIGTIAMPSRYYTLEGSNLYFQVWKDGETINPMLLLNAQE